MHDLNVLSGAWKERFVSSIGQTSLHAFIAFRSYHQRSVKMASVPLLNGESTNTDANVEAQYLLEEQPDFAQVIAADPEGVIAYIERKGVQDLGNFKVQVRKLQTDVYIADAWGLHSQSEEVKFC